MDKSPLPDCLDFGRDLLIRIGSQEAQLLHRPLQLQGFGRPLLKLSLVRLVPSFQ